MCRSARVGKSEKVGMCGKGRFHGNNYFFDPGLEGWGTFSKAEVV